MDPDVIRYFLDQGLDRKIAFLIFLEGVRGYDVKLEMRRQGTSYHWQTRQRARI